MGEEIAFENGRISDFQGLMTLTLDRVIMHTVMRQSSTSTYIPNFIEFEESFCGRTGGRTDVRTFETHFIRSTRRSRRTRVDVHNNQLRLWPEKRAYVLVYHQFFRCRVERQVWMTMGLLTDHSTLMGTW